MKRPFSALTVLMPLLLMPGANAFAYVDPGTGSMILQVILGGFAALAVVGKLYWHRFIAFFRRGKSGNSHSDSESDSGID